MSSKCTAAKAYDILGIYDFPDNFDALNGLHSYLYTNSDMVVEALASQKYDLARDIVTAIETVDKDGSYDDCAFYVSRDGIRILRTAEELIDALGDENGKTASTLLAKNGINVYAEGFQEIGSLFGREGAGVGFAKQADGESFTYAFAWPEGDAWATLTGYLNFDEQPEEYVRRVLQHGGFRSDWDNPDSSPESPAPGAARKPLRGRKPFFDDEPRPRGAFRLYPERRRRTASRRRARYSRRTGYPCHAHRHRRTSARGDPSAG